MIRQRTLLFELVDAIGKRMRDTKFNGTMIYIYIYPVSLSCPLLFHVAQGTASIHVAPTLSGDDLILFGGWIVNCSHDPPPTQGNFVAMITRSHEKLRNSWPWFLTLLQSVIPPQYDNNETVYLISFPLFPLSFFLL